MQKLAPHQIATLRKKQAAAAKAHLGLPAHEIVRLNQEERKRNEAKALMAAGSILVGGMTAAVPLAMEGAAAATVASAAAQGMAEAAVGQAAGAIHPALGVAHAGLTDGVQAMGQEVASSLAQEALLGQQQSHPRARSRAGPKMSKRSGYH
mmetsp:Transcript_70907/g.122886  ORF Transcript_70907/g.122886 Transcript_70907/m.122886 type:complete len:151 (-) Transcript_70907:307-759(-)